MRRLMIPVFVLVLLAGSSSGARAQIRRGLAVDSNVVVKIWNPSGTLRLVAWDRDSLHVEGTAPKWAPFFFGGLRGSVKFGIEEEMVKGELPKAAITAWVPRGSRVSAKTVDGAIEVENVSGYYTTVSGTVRVKGSLRELQVESLRGAIELDVHTPWLRVMGGEGDAMIRGAIDDLAASTVAGRLTVHVASAGRARLETMTGDLTAQVGVEPKGSLELDSHAGTVELVLDPKARVDIEANTVSGEIRNQIDKRRPLPGRGGKGASLSISTDPMGARVIIRTYKGAIVVRRGA
ncbi:MAG TPA: hypothetical protein VJ717_20740 [Gemmatimonadaceae bacterium]|nr:hypothetical protein [Gemmatimonadaceae bacterium]